MLDLDPDGPPDHVLALATLPEPAICQLQAQFPTVVLTVGAQPGDIPDATRQRIAAIATPGKGPVTAELIAHLPALKLISSLSSSLDGIDIAAANARGIAITMRPTCWASRSPTLRWLWPLT